MAQIRHVFVLAGSSKNIQFGTVCGSSLQWQCILPTWAQTFGFPSTITSVAITGGLALRYFLWCLARSPYRFSVSDGSSMISAPRRALPAVHQAAHTWMGSYSALPPHMEKWEPTRPHLKGRHRQPARATPLPTAVTAAPQSGLIRNVRHPALSAFG